MRWPALTWGAIAALAAACGSTTPNAPPPRAGDDAAHTSAPTAPTAPTAGTSSARDGGATASTLPAHHRVADVGAAIREILAADHPRVIGFGEIHSRTDRAHVESSLAHFTAQVLPVLQDQLSDLVLETWIVDPHCGKQATTATAAVESTMRRPAATKSELGRLVDRARAAGIQPHAMRMTCADYARVAPAGKPVAVEVMLDLVTRELGRIAIEAVVHRDRHHAARRLVATYGGALHNDLYPADGVAPWSFAARVDGATGGRYVEVDLYVPELARADAMSQKQPWFPLLGEAGPDHVVVIERGPRSYIVLLPTTPGAAAATP
jgi:hypothetical protein